MTIKEYFQTVDGIAEKTAEIDAIKKQLSENRREIDLDEAMKLKTICLTVFNKKSSKSRYAFVFLFVLIYGMSPDVKIPYSVRYVLSLILKTNGTSISRDWRIAKQMMKEDEEFSERVEDIYNNFTKQQSI